MLWRFKPRETITFGSDEYRPPWHIHNWVPLRASHHATIAVASDHHTWWPSVLTILDNRGHLLGEFVNSGQTFVLASIDTPSGPRLLAGGVRNHEDEVSGRLAILDPSHLSGVSPEDPGSDFECKSCATGHPLKYFVFPPSELNVLTSGTFNQVNYIRPLEGSIHVQTVEASIPGVGSAGMFEFTPDFQLKSARWSDGHRTIHKWLERAHKIHHRWENCPERFGPKLVRMWDPNHGWTELHPNAHKK